MGLYFGSTKIGVSMNDVLNAIYPIGSVYISIDGTKPSVGTWTQLATGRCLWNTASGGGGNIAQALPNIKGTLGLVADSWAGTGAFDWNVGGVSRTNVAHVVKDQETSYNPGFSANKYSSVYQDGANVQPPAIAVTMFKRTA